MSIHTRKGERHVTFGYAQTSPHARVQPTYQAVWSENIHRADGESQGNISFSASRKTRARPVVIEPSRAAALFAQTTAQPLNGGPGLSQKPEHTTGGEERRPIRLPVFRAIVCVRFSKCVAACAFTGRHATIDPRDYKVRLVCVRRRVGLCT